VVCLAPRVPGEIVGPRRSSGVVVRPLNFTVRTRRVLRQPPRSSQARSTTHVLAALVPGLAVKGRVHDPLLNVRWWNHEYHSGVLVVSIAALVGTALVYLLIRRKILRWWAYCLCGAFAGAFPGLFYMIAMPGDDLARVPGFFPLFVSMVIAGFIWGALMGLLIYFAVGRRPQPAGS